MESLTRFIERRLKLQINTEKSAVARPWRRSFLGFTLRNEPELRRCIADKAIVRFKHRVRKLTGRHRGITLEQMIRELVPYLRGWAGYFGFSQWRELQSLDSWIRRRLRCVAWVQWKTRSRRYHELRRLGVLGPAASEAVFSPKGPWRRASRTQCTAPSPTRASNVWACLPWKSWWTLNPPNRRGTDPYARWCGSCALERVDLVAEMAGAVKLSEQPRTEFLRGVR